MYPQLISHSLPSQFITDYNGERIIKIGLSLPKKVILKIKVRSFLWTTVYINSLQQNISNILNTDNANNNEKCIDPYLYNSRKTTAMILYIVSDKKWDQ